MGGGSEDSMGRGVDGLGAATGALRGERGQKSRRLPLMAEPEIGHLLVTLSETIRPSQGGCLSIIKQLWGGGTRHKA